jgi:hypothetical protein
MDPRRLKELKIRYVMCLIEVLRNLSVVGGSSEENLIAVQHVERGLLSALDSSIPVPSPSPAVQDKN